MGVPSEARHQVVVGLIRSFVIHGAGAPDDRGVAARAGPCAWRRSDRTRRREDRQVWSLFGLRLRGRLVGQRGMALAAESSSAVIFVAARDALGPASDEIGVRLAHLSGPVVGTGAGDPHRRPSRRAPAAAARRPVKLRVLVVAELLGPDRRDDRRP